MNAGLLGAEAIATDAVIAALHEQKRGTDWAGKTNVYAENRVRELTGTYGEVWLKGLLPRELFMTIVVPKHSHTLEEPTAPVIFPEGTHVGETIRHYHYSNSEAAAECLMLVRELKEKIIRNGFTSTITLVFEKGELRHVDGLHRMIALAHLLEEGFEYKPIPVFLCESDGVLFV